eukprot:COSAG04_NODE_11854_length_684_cov_1.136752_1_plen_62_part_10
MESLMARLDSTADWAGTVTMILNEGAAVGKVAGCHSYCCPRAPPAPPPRPRAPSCRARAARR